jgi:hypothetical protein
MIYNSISLCLKVVKSNFIPGKVGAENLTNDGAMKYAGRRHGRALKLFF